MKFIKFNNWSIPVNLIISAGITVFLFSFFTVGCSNNGNNNRLYISGNIELTEVNIAFKTSGRLIELKVEEGDLVKKGMLIASLDQEQLSNQRERALAVLAAAKARADQLNTTIQYKKETVQGQIELRQAELSQAQAHLKQLLSGSRTQEIEQARAGVDKARTEYERSKNDWDRAEVLYKNENISTAAYDQYKTRFESAKASLKQADEQLALVIEGPRQEDIESARSLVERSKAALRLAKAEHLEIKIKEQESEGALAEIDRAKAELSIIESQLEDTIAISPVDGIVLVKAAEAGEILAAGTTVVTVGDIFHPWLRGYINEPDLDSVKLGDKVKVTTDSDKIFWGRIAFISSEAEFTPKQIQTKEERIKLVYRIKVNIDNPKGELKKNMPVSAQIILNE